MSLFFACDFFSIECVLAACPNIVVAGSNGQIASNSIYSFSVFLSIPLLLHVAVFYNLISTCIILVYVYVISSYDVRTTYLPIL